MNCDRALALLAGLASQQIDARPDEMDELLTLGLVVETDGQTLWLRREIRRLAAAHPTHFGDAQGSPSAAAAGAQGALAEIEGQLKNDWFRFRSSKATLVDLEATRGALRRVLGLLADPAAGAALQRAVNERALVARGAEFVPCPTVGAGLFALTHRGAQVAAELGARRERFREAKLGTFLAQFDKAEAKLGAFTQQVEQLYERVGYVRKNKAHVVVGLAKTGLPVEQAAGLYTQSLQRAGAPDVAVTLARNASGGQSPAQVQQRLAAAYDLLLRAGCPASPVLQGAAKTLLPYADLRLGAARFVDLCRHLGAARATGDDLIRYAARLMPAQGAPAELAQRTARAARRLSARPGSVQVRAFALGKASVALSAMAPSDDAVDGLCDRFLEIERALVEARLCAPAAAEEHALEAVPCPGTPAEVVSTVRAVALRLSGGGAIMPDHLTIASAFAKRFAY